MFDSTMPGILNTDVSCVEIVSIVSLLKAASFFTPGGTGVSTTEMSG